MPGGMEIRVSANFDRWIDGFGRIEESVALVGRPAWNDAAGVFFGLSQEYVHVVSGELKRSGKVESTTTREGLVARVTYDSDHAIYEEMRGGAHAFLGRAWEQAEHLFDEAMPEAWDRVVESWR